MQRGLLLRFFCLLLGVSLVIWLVVRYGLTSVAAVVGMISVLLTWASFDPVFRQWRSRWEGGPSTPDQLDKAAAALREAIEWQWWGEAERRQQLRSEHQMKVRWELVGEPAYSTDPADGFLRNGPIAALVREYVTKPMQMIVTGGVGSGKTAFCVELILKLVEKEPVGRIPVMFPLSSWDPEESFVDWLIRRLNEEHRILRAEIYGAAAAEGLLRGKRLLPILDGLDELSGQAREVLLQTIWQSPIFVASPFVLTCRADDFKAAFATKAGGKIIRDSWRVTLLPIDPTETASYLREYFLPDDLDRWRPVLDELAENPDGPLTTTLTNPLMLFLVRKTYEMSDSDTEPEELLDRDRFGKSEQIKEHLLDSFVPQIFAPRPKRLEPRPKRSDESSPTRPAEQWPVGNAHAYLTFLAKYLNSLRPPDDRGATELNWWQLREKVPRYVFVVTPAALGAIGCGLLGWLIFGLFGRPVFGIVFGLIFGLSAGFFLGWRSPEPPRQFVLRALTREEFRLKGLLRDLSGFGLVGALAGGLITGLLYDVTYGLVSGLICGLVFAMALRVTQPTELKVAVNPRSVLNNDRAAVIYGWLLGALVGALNGGLLGFIGSEYAHNLIFNLTPIQRGLLGMAVGAVVFGVGLGMTIQATSAWGHFITTRVWLALTRSTPLRLMLFLDDACKLGVLRLTGAHYQFRHALLQDRLANRKT